MSEPGVWYAGTSPQGLLRSEDGGASWEPLPGFNSSILSRPLVATDGVQIVQALSGG